MTTTVGTDVDEVGAKVRGDGQTAEAADAADERQHPARPEHPGRLRYNPALDGIRGLAVAAVLLFHGEMAWARGGFLGVSTFFTLSGFLITSLLVGEHQGTGQIRVTAFWARRLRRLLPASAVTLLAVVASAWVVTEGWERALRGDVIATALNVANWHFLFQDQAYADLFGPNESPVLHFWSLAIEEQFYWVFPLLAAGVFVVGRGSLRVFGLVLGGLLALSAGLTLLYSDAPDTVYYATPIRMGEILVGALLAVVIARGAVVGSRRLAPLAAAGGVVALALSLWAWWNVERATGFLYDGGLLLYAGVSGALVLAACVPGPVRRLLSFEPLRLLGVISYGVYLIHWPVFRLLNPDRVDRLLEPFPFDLHPRGAKLLLVRLVPTLVLAVLSYRVLERPIRNGVRPRRFHAPALAAGTVCAVVLVAGVTPRLSPPPPDEFAEALENIEAHQRSIARRMRNMPPEVPRTLFFGDSSSLMVSAGIGGWGLDNRQIVVPGSVTELGCSIGRGGQRRQDDQRTDVPGRRCNWETTWPAEIERHPEAGIAVVLTGSWDIVDRRIPGDDEWRAPGDPVYDDFLRQELGDAMDLLRARGLTVVWLTTPSLHFHRNDPEPPEEIDPPDADERVARLNELIVEVAAGRQGVAVVDMGGWFAALPSGEDERIRPDGVHVTFDGSSQLALWLGPEILRAAAAAGFVATPPAPPPGSAGAPPAGAQAPAPEGAPPGRTPPVPSATS